MTVGETHFTHHQEDFNMKKCAEKVIKHLKKDQKEFKHQIVEDKKLTKELKKKVKKPNASDK